MHTTMITAILIAAGALPALAHAQEQDPARQLLRDFSGVDADGDDAVSVIEYREIQLARWPQLDRNDDGFLALDDFPRMAARRARTQLDTIGYLDADGDGRISRAEFLGGEAPVFRRADRDDDGLLTRAELEETVSR